MKGIGNAILFLSLGGTILGAIGGGAFAVLSVLEASGAPQQAAGAAVGAVMAIVPYVVTRALWMMGEIFTASD